MLLLLFLVSTATMAQEQGKWTLTLMGGPNQSYIQPSEVIVYDYGSRQANTSFSFREGASGWNIGILLDRRISQRWKVETGMMYNEFRYVVEGEFPHPSISHSTSFQRFTSSSQYISFPVMLKYYLLQGKFDIYLTSGIMADHEPGFRGFHLDFAHRLCIGGLMQLSKHYQVRIEPAFQHALTPYLEYPRELGGYQYRPSVLSFQFGLSRSF